MSGICGLWAIDGTEPDLGPVLADLERRGPDGSRQWRAGPVALGHTLLATTPEALVETLPLTDRASGCTITADARLDNRAELIAALGMADQSRTIGDGELILHAYLEWGEDCPNRLLGDFAFAIHDPRVPRLFCARDQMGMRQFTYCHVEGGLFAFATVDTALLALDGVAKALNEPRIADYLADLEGYDVTSTFFRHIHRLAPAHSLTVDGNGLAIRRYWTLHPPPRLSLPDDAAYAAAFFDVFSEAIRCRLRSANGLGVMVSGGLDSSSVAAVAAQIRADDGKPLLRTLSATDPSAASCSETQAIEMFLTKDGFDPIRIDKSDVGGRRGALIAELDEARNPFEVHGTMLRSIYMAARDDGLKVVLDGGAGDVILTSGNRIAAHLASGRFGRAVREAVAAGRFWRVGHPRTYVAKELLAGAWVAFAPTAIRARRRAKLAAKPTPAIAPQFARRVDFAGRQRDADRHVSLAVRGEAEKRAQSILHPNLVAGRERYDQLAGSFGIESRDPFMDLRVIHFCLSLPPEQLHSDGWPKVVLRRAIEPMVGRAIAWRIGKEHLGGDFSHSLIATWPDWATSMSDPMSPLRHYVSAETLGALGAADNNAPDGLTMRLFSLDRFLRRFGGK